jgi:hypothetical protein
MTVYLDHTLVPSRDRVAAAQLLANILGVECAPARFGPFTSVFVNDGLTLDFDEWAEDFPKAHYCFRVDPAGFEAILARIKAAGVAYRSTPHGPVDYTVNFSHGGSIVYWSEPDGHVWELLTVSYARPAEP